MEITDSASKCLDRDCSIFLTDDDPEDREFFSGALEELHCNVRLTLFSSGEKLLDNLRSRESLPDIICLDLHMPIMDGGECLSLIRSDKKFDTIAIIIYSSILDMQRIEELFRNGANRYLRKPSSYITLRDALERVIESIRTNPKGGMTVINYSG